MRDGRMERSCATCFYSGRADHWKPATREHFFAKPSGLGGISNVCKPCSVLAHRARERRKRRGALDCRYTGERFTHLRRQGSVTEIPVTLSLGDALLSVKSWE
jgi:hypothetical protein